MNSVTLDWRSKGFPATDTSVPRERIDARNWRITHEDLMLPAAVLLRSAIVHNSSWMKRFTSLVGASLAPHGKTTMSRDIIAMQMADGAWGMTAATPGHIRIYREFGIGRIILANQLVGRQSIAYVAGELARDPEFDFYCLVDSFAGVDLLEAGLAEFAPGRPVQVLIELGSPGGRSGLRDSAEAFRVARRIAESPYLTLRGVEAFEGIVQGQQGDEDAVRGLIGRITALADDIASEGWFHGTPILSAGGSAFFDMVAEGFARVPGFKTVLRSGCYIVHDSQFYKKLVERLEARMPEVATLGEGLRSALEVWAYVQSRPEATRLIVGLGKRDVGNDVAPPIPIGWCRPAEDGAVRPMGADHLVVRLDDQHAYLNVPAKSPLRPGDMVSFGISHPCTTFDKWRTLFVVDNDRRVVDLVETSF